MLNHLIGLIVLCFITSFVFGEPFTYQGELSEAGQPANGLFEMEFTLRKASDSTIADGPMTQTIQVIDGLFNANLNFTNGVFENEKLSLQIKVRPDGDPGTLTELLPWIEIHTAPTSQYSLATKGIFVSPTENIGIGTGDASNAKLVVEPNGEAITALFSGDVRVGDPALGLKGNLSINSFNASHALFATNNGAAIEGINTSFTGDFPGIWGATDSTDRNAVGVRGTINTSTSGASSAGLRGINNGLSNTGYGVWGSHAGSGAGIFGTSANGFAGLFAGTVQVNNDLQVQNEIYKDYGTDEYMPAAPVAYGSFDAVGTKKSGTPNLSATIDNMTYGLVIAGENYNNDDYTVMITPHFGAFPMSTRPIFCTPSTGVNGQLKLTFVRLDVTDSPVHATTIDPTLAAFHVVIYRNSP